MALIKVGVLRGGPSQEYEISLKTGKHILNMLAKEPLAKTYKGVDIFIDKEGIWHIDGLPFAPEAALRQVDVIFNATKGEYGEDGKLQQVLETFKMPFVGTKAYGSAVALNKSLAKEHFKKHGIKTPYSKELNLEHGDDLHPLAFDLFRSFPMPVVVKPKGLGSSLGVAYASTVEELVEALDHARGFSSEVIVEEYLTGKEIISGFIDDFRGRDIYHLFPVEVKPHKPHISEVEMVAPETVDGIKFSDLSDEEQALALEHHKEKELLRQNAMKKQMEKHKKHNIMDWASKHSGTYDHESPANLSADEKREIEEAVLGAKHALGLRHFASADFIVHPRRGVYLLEINTQPGLHEHSPIYKALDAAGVGHHEFLDRLIRLALEGEK